MQVKEIKKILCIKLKGIGDVVLSSIVFDSLRDFFPNSEIHFLTEPPSEQLLKKLPFITKVHLFKKKEKNSAINSILKIREEKFDLILDFYSNPRTALITLFSGAKYRAGFPYRGRKYAYNSFGPSERTKYHAADLHLKFLEKLGIPVTGKNLHFGMDKTDAVFADEFWENNFSKDEIVIGICPTGGWASKKCDADVLFNIALKVSNQTGYKILILWGPGDEQDSEYIQKKSGGAFLMSPKSTITQLGALIQKCRAMISNDSGPMHIASAIGTPVLGLFGPTDPRFQGPYGKANRYIRLEELDCIACNLLECPRQHECFKNLPVELVFKRFSEMLAAS